MPSPSTRLQAEQGGEKLTPWKDPAGVKRPRFITQPEGSHLGSIGGPLHLVSTTKLDP